jgi:hypothetical protein
VAAPDGWNAKRATNAKLGFGSAVVAVFAFLRATVTPLLEQIAADGVARLADWKNMTQKPAGEPRRILVCVRSVRFSPDRVGHDVGSFSRCSSPRHIRWSVSRDSRSAATPAGVTV